MIIAVLNFSGNVGKSTIAAHLLHPRMNHAPIISVESLNVDASGDGVDVQRMRGRKFVDLMQQLMSLDGAIVDVGASNAEDFMLGMKSAHGSHEDFDCFVVPTVASSKQLLDTVNTITALSALGVAPTKIRVIFNNVSEGDLVQAEFAALLEHCERYADCVANPNAVIYSNELFTRLRGANTSVAELREDTTPWRERVRQAANDLERERCIQMLTLKRLSGSAGANLDAVFAVLFA